MSPQWRKPRWRSLAERLGPVTEPVPPSLELGLREWLNDALDARTWPRIAARLVADLPYHRHPDGLPADRLLDAADCVLHIGRFRGAAGDHAWLTPEAMVIRLGELLTDSGLPLRVRSDGAGLERSRTGSGTAWCVLSARSALPSGRVPPSLELGLREWLSDAVSVLTWTRIAARLVVDLPYYRYRDELAADRLLDAADCVLQIGQFAGADRGHDWLTPEAMIARLRELLVDSGLPLRIDARDAGLEPEDAVPADAAPEPRDRMPVGMPTTGTGTAVDPGREQDRDGPDGAATGDASRALAGFHVWVAEAAGRLWDSGQRRSAVLAAASRISAETRRKIGLPEAGSDTQLMKHAFPSSPPPAGATFLRLDGSSAAPGPVDSGTPAPAASDADAVGSFAVGCFVAIRDPAAHESGRDWERQVALEYLAALSALARWIDRAEAVTAD